VLIAIHSMLRIGDLHIGGKNAVVLDSERFRRPKGREIIDMNIRSDRNASLRPGPDVGVSAYTGARTDRYRAQQQRTRVERYVFANDNVAFEPNVMCNGCTPPNLNVRT
jgi:hypothetical protein